jgi:hypothetical protein
VSAPTFALLAGLLYMALGILGMLSSLLIGAPSDAPQPAVTMNYGYLFGLFAVNAVLNGVHFLLGFWGLVAWSGALSAVTYARSLTVISGGLALMGLIPGLKTAFGFAPLYGYEVLLHALTAIAAGYFGFRTAARSVAATLQEAPAERRRSGASRRKAARQVANERRKGAFDRRNYGGTLAAG